MNVENVQNSFDRVNLSAPQPVLRPTGRDSPQSTRWQSETASQPPTRSHSLEEDGEGEYKAPIRPSAKALGKRKAVEKTVDPDAFDTDDLFKDPPSTTPTSGYSDSDDSLEYPTRAKAKPIVYVYDAMAEREKERQVQLEAIGEVHANGITLN